MTEKHKLSDWSWESLINPDRSTSIFESKEYVKPTINSIVERLNNIENDLEAVYTMFIIQQKIGAAKENLRNKKMHGSYVAVNPDMVYKLETSLRILLKKRMTR